MKPVSEDKMDEIEEMALRSLRYLDHFVSKYDGKDPKMVQRLKPAMTIAGTWGRLRATEANRMAIERTFTNKIDPSVESRPLPAPRRKAG